MGIEAQDQGYSKNLQAYYHQQETQKLMKTFVLLILTNLVTIYIFTAPFSDSKTNTLLQELNSTRSQLAESHSLLSELHRRLDSTNLLVQALLIDLTRLQDQQDRLSVKQGNDDSAALVNAAAAAEELSLAIGSDEIEAPVGAACLRLQEELNLYMTYDIGGECPVDDVLAQSLMLKGCQPLPRRRCHPKSPASYLEPTPLPDSLWTTPPDSSIVWDPYTCKSHKCLIEGRNINKGYCKDCFDLQGREKGRWIYDDGALDFGIDQVLATRNSGTIRIGLDIGGGTGTFAARMRERNVTIITSTLNLDGPFSSFIASRGLVPMQLSISQRLPFFENTLDIVHSSDVIGNWMPEAAVEFLLYDVYRVLRPGGIFWLDHFFCFESQLNTTYVPMFLRVGFNRLRWHDDAGMNNEWYISALLEKPV